MGVCVRTTNAPLWRHAYGCAGLHAHAIAPQEGRLVCAPPSALRKRRAPTEGGMTYVEGMAQAHLCAGSSVLALAIRAHVLYPCAL